MATNYRSLGRPYFAIALILSFIVIMVMVICGIVSIANALNEAQHQINEAQHQTDIVSQENPTFINCLLGSNSACSQTYTDIKALVKMPGNQIVHGDAVSAENTINKILVAPPPTRPNIAILLQYNLNQIEGDVNLSPLIAVTS